MLSTITPTPTAAPRDPARGRVNACGSRSQKDTHTMMPATNTSVPFKKPGVNSGRKNSHASSAPAGSASP